MPAPPYDPVNKPDPSTPQWADDINQIRNNQCYFLLSMLANGGRLPGWDVSYTKNGNGQVSQIIAVNKTYTSVRMKVAYSYHLNGDLEYENWFWDKGLGQNFEMLNYGTMTASYDVDGDIETINSSNL